MFNRYHIDVWYSPIYVYNCTEKNGLLLGLNNFNANPCPIYAFDFLLILLAELRLNNLIVR